MFTQPINFQTSVTPQLHKTAAPHLHNPHKPLPATAHTSHTSSPQHRKQLGLCTALIGAALTLSTCIPSAYPDDKAITQALAINWSATTPNAEEQKAHELLQLMGGEGSQLDYRIHRVIAQPVGFLIHYDAYIKLRQDGAQSLEQLSDKLLRELSDSSTNTQELPAREHMNTLIAELKAQQDPHAASLEQLMQRMQHCFEGQKAGDEVMLIKNLQAHLWPERNQKWYAQKLSGIPAEISCLPL